MLDAIMLSDERVMLVMDRVYTFDGSTSPRQTKNFCTIVLSKLKV